MTHTNLRHATTDELLDRMSDAQRPQLQAAGALAARLSSDVSEKLGGVSAGLFDVKRQMVERLDALTAELATLRMSLDKASADSAEHTSAMEKLTRALVRTTIAYTVITGGLLIAAFLR